MLDAEALLDGSRRPLVLGIGGGGDVVGALATAEHCRRYGAATPIVGGVAWERRSIDPFAGPHALEEIDRGAQLAPSVLAAGPRTAVRMSGVRFAESHMARFLGTETLLVDVLGGPRAVADGIEAAAERLGADLLVFIDVGGDVFGHGGEAGLASPLCDAVMLAAASWLAERRPVLGGVFGPGCDGELTLEELAAGLAAVAAAGGLAGARGLTPPVAATLEEVVLSVPTEASAQALRCFRGAYGTSTIRGGARAVPLTPFGTLTIYFDVSVAMRSAANLALAVRDTACLEQANDVLHALGVGTELDLERQGIDR